MFVLKPLAVRPIALLSSGQLLAAIASEIYRVALAAMGALPDGSVHVGDSLRWDVGGAQKAGMKGAWLRNGSSGAAADRYAAHGPLPTPDLVLETLVGATPAILALLHEG